GEGEAPEGPAQARPKISKNNQKTQMRTASRERRIERMSRRENYIKVVAPKLTERGIIAKHWPGNWEEEISFSNFALLRTIAAMSVDAIWPPSSDEVMAASRMTVADTYSALEQLVKQGMLHDGDYERGF